MSAPRFVWKVGERQGANRLNTEITPTFGQCAALCDRDSECIAYSWRDLVDEAKPKHECTLYGEPSNSLVLFTRYKVMISGRKVCS